MFRLILILALLWPALTQARTVVRFHDEAQVTGPRLVLTDIAAIEPADAALAQLPVGAAPAPGKSKTLNAAALAGSLRRQVGIADISWQGSQTIVVRRLGQRITRNDLENMINHYLQDSAGSRAGAEYRFTLTSAPEELTAPTGDLRGQVTPSRQGAVGNASFSVALTVDGESAGACLVRGKVAMLTEVVVTTRPMHRGDTFDPADLAVQKQDIAGVSKPLTDVESVVGMQAARAIPAGAVLSEEQVVQPPVIKDGDEVKIFARKGALQISTRGLAMRDGRPGDLIQVKNISTNKILRCRVDGPNTVSVEF